MALSKLGKTLRELGFRKVPDLTVRREEKAKVPPSFTSFPDPAVTFATDDWGYSWMKDECLDLAPHGFNNLSKSAREVAEAMDLIRKSH